MLKRQSIIAISHALVNHANANFWRFDSQANFALIRDSYWIGVDLASFWMVCFSSDWMSSFSLLSTSIKPHNSPFAFMISSFGLQLSISLLRDPNRSLPAREVKIKFEEEGENPQCDKRQGQSASFIFRPSVHSHNQVIFHERRAVDINGALRWTIPWCHALIFAVTSRS